MPAEVLYNTHRVQRAIRDLTLAELTELGGVTRESVGTIGAGRMVPSVLLALKLVRVLGIAVDNRFSLDGAASR